jgi:endonuclease/exonuclease/phosphatase (EEP) superfamily protein YafD
VKRILLASVYRAPSCSVTDTERLCELLDTLMAKHNHVIIAGDFNVPHIVWSSCQHAGHNAHDIITRFASDHHLSPLAKQPTRNDALLDLVFVSSDLVCGDVINLRPIGESDHVAQLLQLPQLTDARLPVRLCSKVDYDQLRYQFSQIDCTVAFNQCITTDDFAN